MAEPDAGGRARGNDVARIQRHEAADVADQVAHPEYHLRCVAVLTAPAVDVQPQVQALRVRHFIRRDEPGSDRSEGVAALALDPLPVPLQLEFPLGNVVDDAVTGDMFQGFGFGHIRRPCADHHAEFHFPVGLRGIAGNDDRVVRPADGAGGLEEDHRLIGHGTAALLRMFHVIPANANDFSHVADTGPDAHVAGYGGKSDRVSVRDLRQRFGVQVGAVQVGNHGRQVPNYAVPIQLARPLRAGLSNSQELHRSCVVLLIVRLPEEKPCYPGK